MRTSIVLGLMFGDEGKGLVTSCLTKEDESTLIIRFNGGHQAGHTVGDDNPHIFSNFGSGTLNGAATYWSEYCTFYPISFYNERKALYSRCILSGFFIHPLAMVTTPFDIEFNKKAEAVNQHGSVGVGFGATVARHTETPYKLFAIDLLHTPILIHKLQRIAEYYNYNIQEERTIKTIDHFVEICNELRLNIRNLSAIKNDYRHIIFEGAQGIMLDMDFGFFPNVTRSNTTSKNALEIIKDNNLPEPEIYYCMRSYLTRHGKGYMPNEESLFFEDKTNVLHPFQGPLRQGFHSFQLIDHALSCDKIYSGNLEKSLAITCLNQTNDKILIDNSYDDVNDFAAAMKVDNVYISRNKTNISLLTSACIPKYKNATHA